ncbi:MAG: hypothetical protein ACK587_17420 [Cyanobacteriota bacterium]
MHLTRPHQFPEAQRDPDAAAFCGQEMASVRRMRRKPDCPTNQTNLNSMIDLPSSKTTTMDSQKELDSLNVSKIHSTRKTSTLRRCQSSQRIAKAQPPKSRVGLAN